jgi:hypothetical protein
MNKAITMKVVIFCHISTIFHLFRGGQFNKMFANILSIFPSFNVLTDEKKFLYLFQCEEYDIVEVIVRGVNEMYNRRNELIDKYIVL